ncbi:hypothetical protein V6N11_070057 [Hibiscus sabdariffa]|uniref:BED-type domain-containing protein n=1 Tax=Hibiscus sabdariffa TaxID=183260 RepID=A0ABR2QDW5_9ROSI
MSSIGLGTSDGHSTLIAKEFGINLDDANEMDEDEIDLENAEVHVPQTNATNNNSEVRNVEDESESHPFKRAKKSVVWKEFGEPERVGNSKVWKVPCVYCKALLTISKGGPTTHLKRHSDKCVQRKVHIRQQQKLINLLPSDSTAGSPSSGFVSALHDGKFDLLKMREGIAHWIVMHEHAFSIVEEEGFNMMLKMGMPQWKSVSRHTIRNDSFKVYEIEKNKLKEKLKNVDRISLTTELWRSKPQKIEYMVLTAHFVNRDWKLQKRVLNFVHIPPPRKGKDIANCIFKCLKEWDIENKHGLKQVKSIIKNVHDTVDYLNGSEQRLKKFAELAQQFNLKERRLVLECKTRWNSTYEMLDCATKFKEVFARLALEDREYVYCPTLEDWGKIENFLEILKVFYDTTNVISGSEYPTSNLFLSEIYRIKLLLDTSSKSSDDFVKGMVTNMKERFDKYWGECNLLMAIGAVLDPRLKMKVIEITFPKMFSPDVVRENIHKVRETLYELYDEYVNLYSPPLMEQMGECGTSTNVCGEGMRSTPRLLEILQAKIDEDQSKEIILPAL